MMELWLIFLVSAIRSVGGGIQAPAVGALLPQIVPTDKLVKVNGINGTIQPFIMIAAPVASGALLSISRLEAIFFIDVVTAAIAVSLLLLLKVKAHQKAGAVQATGYLDDLKAGLTYIRNNHDDQNPVHFLCVYLLPGRPGGFSNPFVGGTLVRRRSLETNRQ